MAHKRESGRLSESDIAAERMGRNNLQGDDQANVRNERKAVPDVKKQTDAVVESFKKLDKDYRAQEDLGKGNRKSDSSR